MLFPTIIVALVLVCAEINGSFNNNNSQVHLNKAGGTLKKGTDHQLRSLDSKTPSEVKEEVVTGSQRQFGYPGNPGGYPGYPGSISNGFNYVAVGAGGEAEVAFKLDMSVFMEKLNMIPQLYQVIGNMIQKIDILLYQRYPGSQTQGGQGWQSEIFVLQQALLARFDQQDAKLNALYQLIQQLQGELGGISQQINQVYMILQTWLQNGNGGVHWGGGDGGNCGQQMVVFDGLIRQVMDMVTQVLRFLETPGNNPGNGNAGTSGSVADIVMENFRMLRKCFSMIQLIGLRMNQGCPSVVGPPGGFPGSTGTLPAQLFQELASIISMLEAIPQQTVLILQNSGIFNGGGSIGGGGLLPYVQQIIQMCQALNAEIMTMSNSWIEGFNEIRSHMADNRRNMVAVKKVVTETTEMMQSSAAAAISASRSMKCPTLNKKGDLQDKKKK